MAMAKALSCSLAVAPCLGIPSLSVTRRSLNVSSSNAIARLSPLLAHKFPSSSSSPQKTLAPCLALASSLSTVSSAPVSVGDKLPESTFAYLDKEGQVQTVSVSDLTKGKKAVLFAVPGAFTPTCSQKHLPGFVEKADELRAKGVDTIACISVNDVFVMRAWGESIGVGDKVLLLSDGNLNFTNAIGVTLDLTDKPVGLGVRSRRYSLLAEDGIIKVLHLEEGGSFTTSGADDILKAL